MSVVRHPGIVALGACSASWSVYEPRKVTPVFDAEHFTQLMGVAVIDWDTLDSRPLRYYRGNVATKTRIFSVENSVIGIRPHHWNVAAQLAFSDGSLDVIAFAIHRSFQNWYRGVYSCEELDGH